MKVMKAKNYLFVAGLALVAISCNKIDKPFVEQVDTFVPDSSAFPDTNTNTQRHVLIEEFTGHTCAPCPGGAKLLRQLQATYEAAGKKLFLIGIHEGSQAYPHLAPDTTFLTEFRVKSGTELANNFFSTFLPATPAALVNRASYMGDVWIYDSDWQIVADAQFAKPNVVNLDIIGTYDDATKDGTVGVRCWFKQAMTGNYRLVVYLVQDSIVDWQKNGPLGTGDDAYPLNQDVQNYYHRHVLRGTISNLPGEPGYLIDSLGSVAAEEKKIVGFNFNLDDLVSASKEDIMTKNYPAFDHNHFIFVAFVYDEATNEILQVEEKHLH